jgi:hypothetical protein
VRKNMFVLGLSGLLCLCVVAKRLSRRSVRIHVADGLAASKSQERLGQRDRR